MRVMLPTQPMDHEKSMLNNGDGRRATRVATVTGNKCADTNMDHRRIMDLARRLDDATVRYLPWRLLVTQLLLSMLLWLLGLLMWLRLLMLLVPLWRNCCLLLA